MTEALRIYIEREDEQYVAQCVDIDIVGFGADPDAAIQSFIRAYIRTCVAAHEAGQSIGELPPPAEEVVRRWQAFHDSGHATARSFAIPEFDIRPRRARGACTHRRGEAVIAA